MRVCPCGISKSTNTHKTADDDDQRTNGESAAAVLVTEQSLSLVYFSPTQAFACLGAVTRSFASCRLVAIDVRLSFPFSVSPLGTTGSFVPIPSSIQLN